jgi:hypothetical protein
MANVKISALSSASPLIGTEEVPLVQGGVTLKTTTQDIADLAGGGGTANYGVAQVIGATGSPSSLYDFNTLFPTITFAGVAVSLKLTMVYSDGPSGSNFSSTLYNVVRANSTSNLWSYTTFYSQQYIGSSVAPSFIISGTESNPNISFYVSPGYTLSAILEVITTV